MCPECGNYRGRVVVDMVAKKAARLMRREEKLKALGEDQHVHEEEVHETPKNEKEEKLEAKKKEVKETVKVAKKAEAKKEK